ncbi:Dihydroorotase [Chlamydiales bacterium SCGC AG-110-M15]|nr:Dihydroorotase [Chlamydiales bacterium SCGC AG-110-M15]
MIRIKNVKDIHGKIQDVNIESKDDQVLDASGLTILPALIDPHVHFRTPGAEYKEDWMTGAQAAIAGGVTTVFDMPNNTPSCVDEETLTDKIKLINQQLKDVDIPLRGHLYFGASKNYLDEIGKAKDRVIGLKIFMGSSTGDLLMDDDASMLAAFREAAKHDLIVGVHAEDECVLKANQKRYSGESQPSVHSKIRSHEAALSAVEKAIHFAEISGATLYILHSSTAKEIECVRQAKKRGLPVYVETTPHHLFFNEEAYAKWGTCVQMNPPLRLEVDQEALWEGIRDGTIDSIGTDHAPHTLEEKHLPYGKAPSGVPGIETILPLLLNAHHDGKVSLERIVEVTRRNIERMFNLENHDDCVLVDLDLEKAVVDEELKTKCRWSPFSGQVLRGWPVYTILKGRVYEAAGKRCLIEN